MSVVRPRVFSPGHVAFAVTMAALGVMGLVERDFAPGWPPVPQSVPGRTVLILLCGLVPLLCGIGLLWPRLAAVAARVLLAYYALWFLALRVPLMAIAFGVNTWWASAQTAAMVAACWVLFARLSTERDRERLGLVVGERGVRIAQGLFGLGLIPFGIAHFLYPQATIPLVPGWIPGHAFWAYFTGVTFIAAGIAMVIGVWRRLAAVLATLQMGLFTLLVWVPIVIHGANAGQWSEFVVSWVLTAAAWVVSESYERRPVPEREPRHERADGAISGRVTRESRGA